MNRRIGVFLGAALACMVWASVALAQDPSTDGYGGAGGNVQEEVGGGAGGGLPFTGLDLLLIIGAGLLLLAAGLTMRRLGRAKS